MKPIIHRNHDLADIEAISQRVRTAIDAASLGMGSWEAVIQILSEAFPGSTSGIQAMNFASRHLDFVSASNLERQFEESYREHFAFLNPMIGVWSTSPDGVAIMSEDVASWRAFDRTEFYNDWLKPQGGMIASGSVKIGADRGETINLSLSYPLNLSEKYDRALQAVLQNSVTSLQRAIKVGQSLRVHLEAAASGSGLVQRSEKAAFVMAADRTVLNANELASQMFSRGGPVMSKSGRVSIVPGEIDAQFETIIQEPDSARYLHKGRLLFRWSEALWQLTATPIPTLPEHAPKIVALLRPRQLFLVLISQIAPRLPDERVSLESMSGLYGLTTSEIALCSILLAGKTVSQAAEELGVTVGTARNRLKMIQHKTETSRQSELIMLLNRLK